MSIHASETLSHLAESHHHTHEHEPVIAKGWKWAAALGNAAVGAIEIAMGKLDALSVTGDGVHNGGDAISYYLQADNEIKGNKLSPEKKYLRRKIGHTVIAACSGVVAAKAGMDIGLEHESHHNHLTLYAASASLALNGLLYARLHKGIQRAKERSGRRKMTATERDLTKHMIGVDIPSAVLAGFGAVMQRYGVEIPTEALQSLPAIGSVLPGKISVEQTAGVASGVLGAYLFRPTEKNLSEDNCPLHGGYETHGGDCGHEEDHGHGHEQKAEASRQPTRRLRWHEKLSSQVFATGIYAIERTKHWTEKSPVNDEVEETEKKTKSWMRKAKLGAVAVAGAFAGAAAYHVTKGAFMPEPGMFGGGGTLPSLPDTVPESQPLPPPAPELLPTPEVPLYPAEATAITDGKSWWEVFDNVGIEPQHRLELLEQIGGRLEDMHYADGTPVAYFEDFGGEATGEWRLNMSPDKRMPLEVLDLITAEARSQH